MSEKPFWEGKTCEEMANLHVKVTFVAGAVLTGITDGSGHIRRSSNGSGVPISPSRRAERFVPYRDIESIELVDDPEYERIDNIEDVREGDTYVGKDGNRYTVIALDKHGHHPLQLRIYEGACCWPQRDYFAYALRPKLQLPDHDGLWFDKDNNLWLARGEDMRRLRNSSGEWGALRTLVPIDSVQARTAAPFRPAKAVEA